MTHRRCCDNPDNLRELGGRGRLNEPGEAGQGVTLVCIECGTVLATADERGELFADY